MRVLACALSGLVSLSSGGCAEELPGFAPPVDQLHYPVSLAIADQHLLVVNSNFDQRYNAGSITALSLAALSAAVPGADVPVVLRDLPADGRSQIKISAFGGQVLVVPREGDNEVYVASRRGNRVTRAQFSGGALSCGNGAVTERVLGTDCTPGRTLETVANDSGEDPFALAFVPTVGPRGTVVVGALRALFVANDATPIAVLSLLQPEVVDANLAAEQTGGDQVRPMTNVVMVGVPGAIGVAPIPGTDEILVAGGDTEASDIFANRAAVGRAQVRSSTAGLGLLRRSDITVGAVAGADATRGVVVTADATRAFASLRVRQPSGSAVLFNSVVAVISPSESRTLAVLEVGEELGPPTLLERPGQQPARLLYIPDLRSARVFVVDVSTDSPALLHIIEPTAAPGATQRLMAGPAQVLIVPEAARAATGGRTLAFVASFANSTLGVLDLSDPDPRRHRMLARLGRALSDDGVDEVE